MATPKPGRISPLVVVLILLLVASLVGVGYLYYQTTSLQGQSSSLQSQVSSLQGLAKADASIKVVDWYGSQSGSTATFEVKVTNGNSFDVTLTQLTISVVDNTGAQVSGNTLAPQVIVAAGNSITTEISVTFPDSASGHSIQAILNTPYGQITIGSA